MFVAFARVLINGRWHAITPQLDCFRVIADKTFFSWFLYSTINRLFFYHLVLASRSGIYPEIHASLKVTGFPQKVVLRPGQGIYSILDLAPRTASLVHPILSFLIGECLFQHFGYLIGLPTFNARTESKLNLEGGCYFQTISNWMSYCINWN